jgi:hypothetical protein
MSFAQRLLHERTFKGWSAEQLAAASGVSAQQITRIEQRRVEAPEQAMTLLMAALGVDMHAPPSQRADTVVPAAHVVPAPVPPQPSEPVAPPPLALHLPVALREMLEAAAVRNGRSLHGEVLARLEACTESAAANGTHPASATNGVPAQAAASVTWSDADVQRMTQLVAQRLQAMRNAHT